MTTMVHTIISDNQRGATEKAVQLVVQMAERAEAANQSELSSWYGSVCKWLRERERAAESFTLTLPDPAGGGDPLTVIEVRVEA